MVTPPHWNTRAPSASRSSGVLSRSRSYSDRRRRSRTTRIHKRGATSDSLWFIARCSVHIELVPSRSPRPLPITDPAELSSALRDVEERDRRVVELRYGLED